MCVRRPELVHASVDVSAVVIPKLFQHQTQTKGCLHVLTLDKCLVWLYTQLYQFSNRSLSLSLSLSLSHSLSLCLSVSPSLSVQADLMTHRNASSRLSEINHLRQVVLPIV